MITPYAAAIRHEMLRRHALRERLRYMLRHADATRCCQLPAPAPLRCRYHHEQRHLMAHAYASC